MNISNKTILLTGGAGGIGEQTAKLLSEKGNKVLIIGRNAGKLEKVAGKLKNVTAFACDITNAEDVKKLVEKVRSDFNDLSVIINNAAIANSYNLVSEDNLFDKAGAEFLTNYFSVIRLNENLIPVLKLQKEALIVNVTSVVALVPAASIPTYSDSKAALHSYSLVLRHELAKSTAIKVVELMPPLVNTELAKAIGGETHGMPPLDVAQALIDGIENDSEEIHVGQAKDLRGLFLSNPAAAFQALNPVTVAG